MLPCIFLHHTFSVYILVLPAHTRSLGIASEFSLILVLPAFLFTSLHLRHRMFISDSSLQLSLGVIRVCTTAKRPSLPSAKRNVRQSSICAVQYMSTVTHTVAVQASLKPSGCHRMRTYIVMHRVGLYHASDCIADRLHTFATAHTAMCL